ncbi:MAG: sugar phosphate isomerase/epimerase [Clostridiales bacterium]|nr:sugar phosphate isomerase/epimerase [Clostridiales bacterium]
MKLGVLTVPFGSMELAEMLSFVKKQGIEAVELGAGGYPGKKHCDPDILLNDENALQDFKNIVADSGIEIGALSAHGNPVHPDKDIARKFHNEFEKTVLLAEKLGINHVIGFSGCPGGSPEDETPNWITCPWPEDFTNALEYQWNDILIPYWQKEAQFCKDHGVTKVALEMHPGFCVHNPETLMNLRNATDTVIGANFDPSHLFWQGIDSVSAIRYLADAIHFFHAKDTKIDKLNTERIGVLDTKHYSDEINRSWVFRTVGYGHSQLVWKDIFSALRLVGYDHVISIEHEDSLMSSEEGLKKAVAFLKETMIFEASSSMHWA